MGIKHVSYVHTISGGPFTKLYHTIGQVKEMPNDDLKWQVRFCKIPGEVHVIAAFKECEDAITFMSILNENLEHGFIIKHNDRTIYGFGSDKGSYMLEHNSSTEYVEQTYKTK